MLKEGIIDAEIRLRFKGLSYAFFKKEGRLDTAIEKSGTGCTR